MRGERSNAHCGKPSHESLTKDVWRRQARTRDEDACGTQQKSLDDASGVVRTKSNWYGTHVRIGIFLNVCDVHNYLSCNHT